MLKLKKNVMDFLKENVEPEHIEACIKRICDCYRLYEYDSEVITVPLLTNETLLGVYIQLGVSKCDFEEVEELKPYVWYSADKFDGNPHEYWLIERVLEHNGRFTNFYDDIECLNELEKYTTHFMYIEPLKVEYED